MSVLAVRVVVLLALQTVALRWPNSFADCSQLHDRLRRLSIVRTWRWTALESTPLLVALRHPFRWT